MFYIIQPWQQDPRRKYEHAGQALSTHPIAADACAELDRLVERLTAGGLPPDTLELYVVSADDRLVQRQGTH
jgi:hypothetical protein